MQQGVPWAAPQMTSVEREQYASVLAKADADFAVKTQQAQRDFLDLKLVTDAQIESLNTELERIRAENAILKKTVKDRELEIKAQPVCKPTVSSAYPPLESWMLGKVV